MKIWKTKTGEKIDFKEFMNRWKSGIEGISPSQKIKTQITGTKIMLIGLFLGLCVSIYGWKNLWWVGIILIGALLNTGVQFLGLKQQKKILDDLEKQFKEPEEEIKETKKNKIIDVKVIKNENDLKPILEKGFDKDTGKFPLDYVEMEKKKIKAISNSLNKEKKEVKPVILDNNPLSIAKYAEEFPENFEEISKSLDKEKEKGGEVNE